MMNKKFFLYLSLILVIIIIILIFGYWFLVVKSNSSLAPSKQTENNFQYNEIIKKTIGTKGGVLENSDKSVIVTIPPLKQDTEITLGFKRSGFVVRAGVGSPITISLSPNISLVDSKTPISIKVKYSSDYNLPVPYLVDNNNKLQSVDLGNLDKQDHYFTILTFHGGDYSWVYAD